MTDASDWPEGVVCRGCWALMTACGKCPKCRMQVHHMRKGLLKVAARCEDSSPADVFAQVADAFDFTVAELEQVLKHEGYRG